MGSILLRGEHFFTIFSLQDFIHSVLIPKNSSDLAHFILTPRDNNDQITRSPEAPDPSSSLGLIEDSKVRSGTESFLTTSVIESASGFDD